MPGSPAAVIGGTPALPVREFLSRTGVGPLAGYAAGPGTGSGKVLPG